MMELIAAADRNWGIGRTGDLLCRIPADLSHFRTLTYGQSVLYGRRTLTTFPNGEPLSGRKNLVLTHHPASLPVGCIPVCSLAEALALSETEHILLVGGASVFAALSDFCTRAYITKVDADLSPDVFCPNLDRSPNWKPVSEGNEQVWNGLCFRFCIYEQIK